MLLDGDRSGSNLEIWTGGNTGKWKKLTPLLIKTVMQYERQRQ
ncbi:hypothetical protein [Moraxella caprae]|nr:hypothetical protein [Moraxella caprae]